ncbi:hypothetical protein DIZ76_017326 [Coccidioides immitis]|nr:hypothetical protein DIZ76_017326 [Coccidioides immitis]
MFWDERTAVERLSVLESQKYRMQRWRMSPQQRAQYLSLRGEHPETQWHPDDVTKWERYVLGGQWMQPWAARVWGWRSSDRVALGAVIWNLKAPVVSKRKLDETVGAYFLRRLYIGSLYLYW